MIDTITELGVLAFSDEGVNRNVSFLSKGHETVCGSSVDNATRPPQLWHACQGLRMASIDRIEQLGRQRDVLAQERTFARQTVLETAMAAGLAPLVAAYVTAPSTVITAPTSTAAGGGRVFPAVGGHNVEYLLEDVQIVTNWIEVRGRAVRGVRPLLCWMLGPSHFLSNHPLSLRSFRPMAPFV